jgi:hypothetical protein
MGMAKLSDTSADAERILRQVYRRQTPGQKWLRLGSMYDSARALHAAGVKVREPSATAADILARWLCNNLGFRHPIRSAAEPGAQPMQFLRETRDLVRILDRLGIAYALSGSMACSVHGIDRYTRDADFSVEPFPGREAELIAAFGPDYYISDTAVRDAVQRRTSFNAINTATGFKADFFVRKDVAFESSAMSRRLSLSLPDDPSQPIVFHSAEDILLFKLHWYRLGNETSEQQWNDVLGILRTQAEKLDSPYLDRWSADLGVADLLNRARVEAQL